MSVSLNIIPETGRSIQIRCLWGFLFFIDQLFTDLCPFATTVEDHKIEGLTVVS